MANDLIDRQDAIDAVQSIGRLATLPDNDAVIRMSAVEYVLFNMPSAQSERITLTEEERRTLKKMRTFYNGSYAKLLDKLFVSAQPDHIGDVTEMVGNTISRQDVIDSIVAWTVEDRPDIEMPTDLIGRIKALPAAQPEIIRCKDCIYYDPPHVENNGVRYEYDEMPADAFDALGTGLVNAEYGINIGGRCCVDYYCKNYSDDKRVFVREDNYCGRAERRTDE